MLHEYDLHLENSWKILTCSAHLSFWLRLQASIEHSAFWLICLVNADLIQVCSQPSYHKICLAGKEHLNMCCIFVCQRVIVSGRAARTWDYSNENLKELNSQLEISQSWRYWCSCSGTSKPGLFGHRYQCEREEADLQLATIGDPDRVRKAVVRMFASVWVSLHEYDIQLKSSLLQIKVIFIPKVTLFLCCLEEITNMYFSPVDKVCHNVHLQNRSLICRHWLPAGV